MNKCCLVVTSFVVVVCCLLSLLLWLFLTDVDEPKQLASCGGCHCIVDPTSPTAMCPTDVPRHDYTEEEITTLRLQRPVNPFNLECDPYDDENCHLSPSEVYTELGDTAVCGLLYNPLMVTSQEDMQSIFAPSDGGGVGLGSQLSAKNSDTRASCPNAPLDYVMASYPSREHALADGATVTHVGACGACSTTQDLAVYLSVPDLVNASKYCIKKSLLNQKETMKCFQGLGFSESCARIWIANGENTAQRCAIPCTAMELQNYNNNGAAPECSLNSCLACNAESSGSVFDKFAGRTRRRSGVLSTIARSCEESIIIDHGYACPYGTSGVAALQTP